MSSSRKSSRIAGKKFGSSTGPTHVDLSEELPSPPPAVNVDEVSDAPPIQTRSSKTIYKVYEELTRRKTPVSDIYDYIKGAGFTSLFTFLEQMEKLLIAPPGSAGIARKNFPLNPSLGSPEEFDPRDEEERLYCLFKPVEGIAVGLPGFANQFFKSSEHKEMFQNLLGRGVMNPRSVDFDFLDSQRIKMRLLCRNLHIEQFCSNPGLAYPELTAYFYSNLSFPTRHSLEFTVKDQSYTVDVDDIAQIIGVPPPQFFPIETSDSEMISYLSKDDSSVAPLVYSRMTVSNIVLHKILINCLRPKAASRTDVSHTEARIMFGMLKLHILNLPFMILYQMYRASQKAKGQLPYAGLITQIFNHLNISLPTIFCKLRLPETVMGKTTLAKMRIPGLSSKQAALSPAPSSIKRKGKAPLVPPSAKKSKPTLLKDTPPTSEDLYQEIDDYVPAEEETVALSQPTATSQKGIQIGERPPSSQVASSSSDDEFHPTPAAVEDEGASSGWETPVSMEAGGDDAHETPSLPDPLQTGGGSSPLQPPPAPESSAAPSTEHVSFSEIKLLLLDLQEKQTQLVDQVADFKSSVTQRLDQVVTMSDLAAVKAELQQDILKLETSVSSFESFKIIRSS